MKKKIISKVALLVALLFVLAACGGNGGDATAQVEQPDPPQANGEQVDDVPEPAVDGQLTIGYAALSLNNEFIRILSDALEERGRELGVNVITTDGQDSIERQVSQIEDFIAMGVDAIVLNPTDAQGLNSSVDAAAAAGIPLILVNTNTTNENFTSFVGSSNVESGVIQGDFLAELFADQDEVNVVLLRGVLGHSAEIDRFDGLYQTFLYRDGVEVIADQTGNWTREEGMRHMEDWLQAHPQIDVLAAQNDEMALGALEAIRAAGRLDEIVVVGIDAIADALNSIESGEMLASVFQDAAGQGRGAIEVAVSAAQGESVPHEYLIPYLLVTNDNLEEFR